MAEKVRPFEVTIPAPEVSRLYERLLSTRVPTLPIVPGAGSDYGISHDWAKDLYKYWLESYSWPNAAKRITSWPHFTTDLEGLSIHFVHARSSKEDAIPILLVHGWPGSFYEFSEVIDRLRDGDHEQTFHCVAPSLPGFCWSGGPPRGWTLKDTARIFHASMLRLGYQEYVVQAGDWGHWVGRELGAQYADSCRAVQFNYAPGVVPEGVELTEREQRVQDRRRDWLENHLGYAILMRTRPMTLGWMLQDNPVAIMVWVGEKYAELADPKKQQTGKWKDHILTTVCLYHFSNCAMTASLVYYENIRHETFAQTALQPENKIIAPMGYSSFYYDSAPSSERAIERTGNLVMYRERDDGGHFACLESPEEVVDDVRELVKISMKSRS